MAKFTFRLTWFAAFTVLVVHGQTRIMTTYAGNDNVFTAGGVPAAIASVGRITSVTLDAQGQPVVADPTFHVVWTVTNGQIRIIAGNNIQGQGTNGASGGFSGDGGSAAFASLNFPMDCAYDQVGNLYIADSGNRRIRKVTPAGIISTFAGTGIRGFNGDGPVGSVNLNAPVGVLTDPSGNVFVNDNDGVTNRIRRISNGVVTTVAGNGQVGDGPASGPAPSSPLNDVQAMAMDAGGALYLSEFKGNRIRKVVAGQMTVVAGTGAFGFSGDGGSPLNASLADPGGVAVDASGNIFIADTGNQVIRKVSGNVITTIAGNGKQGVSPDKTPALSASFFNPEGLAITAGNELYICDRDNFRLRKLDAANLVSSPAGNGSLIRGHDGGPAVLGALIDPFGVTVDPSGGVYIADTDAEVIRHVDASQMFTTVAGNGANQFSGDGGSALQAGLATPFAVALDPSGTLFIADQDNNRVRRVGTNGAINTYAGNGTNSGDNIPVAQSKLAVPSQVAFDPNGLAYIAEFTNNRIRRVDKSGVISTYNRSALNKPAGIAFDDIGNLYVTEYGAARVSRISPDGAISVFAGGGQLSGSASDGQSALMAKLVNPSGITVDANRNVYFSDATSNRVYQVTPGQIIRTVAGNGQSGYSGDGGLATNASLHFPWGVAFDNKSGTLYIADVFNNRIRAALPVSPSFSVSEDSLALTGSSGGAITDQVNVALSSSFPGLLYTVQTSGDIPLQVTPVIGAMPALLQVTTDPSALSKGSYQGSITISVPGANPPVRIVRVSLQANESASPKLAVNSTAVNFALSTGGVAVARPVAVTNAGGGSLIYNASVVGSAPWLQVSAGPAATPNGPGFLTITANPAGLDAGTYTGRVDVTSPSTSSGQASIAVTLAVTRTPVKLQLSSQGLSFNVVGGGGIPLAKTIYVYNGAQGSLDWAAATSVTSPAGNWLSLSARTGTVSSGSSGLSQVLSPVTMSVDATGLTAATYYGSVDFTTPNDLRQLQSVTVVLNVLAAGSELPVEISPNALVFSGSPGTNPGAQEVKIAVPGSANMTYTSSHITSDGQNWLAHTPASGSLAPNQPGRILVQPDYTGLQSGQIYTGKIVVLIGGTAREVNILASAAGGTDTLAGKVDRQASCNPSPLTITWLKPSQPASASIGSPVDISLKLTDGCGKLVPSQQSNVDLSFSNLDLSVYMQFNSSTQTWDWSWTPAKGGESQTVKLTALASLGVAGGSQPIRGGNTLSVALGAQTRTPLFASNALLNAASFKLSSPLSPGELVSIFGSKLADGPAVSSSSLPIPNQLGGASVRLGDRDLPILYASDSQLNVQIPYDIPVNFESQVIVKRGDALSIPLTVIVAPAQPGIYTTKRDGSGQGAIFNGITNVLADSSAPAHAGDIIIIYCNGLGPVDPVIASGVAVTGPTPTKQTVTALIGGQPALVQYAGLAPGFPGLYQVNLVVPGGTGTGDQIAITLSVAGQTSPPATIAVR